MGRFFNIGRNEMEAFLKGQGFQQMSIPGTIELVYGKIVYVAGHKLSLRVYTAINPSGESREKGSDAIRVQLYWMFDNVPRPVGKAQKCLRVASWKINVQAAIDRHSLPEFFKVCPACGSPMVLRTNSNTNAEFWGCVTWAKTGCNGKPKEKGPTTLAIVAGPPVVASNTSHAHAITSTKAVNPYRISDDKISDRQRAVEQCFVDDTCNILMGARAGSGKTTMLRHLASFRKPQQSVAYLAFGKKNAAEGRNKLPREVSCSTTHGFCNRWLRQTLKMPKDSNESKTWQLLEDIYPAMSNPDRKRIRKSIFRLVGLAKNFACKPGDSAALQAAMEQYSFELENQQEVHAVLDVTGEVLEKSLPRPGYEYCFDDLLWWPIVLEMKPPKYDVVLADECQDFNACQIELLRRLAEGGSRIIAVGDPYQAVFRFRGADSDAYDKLKAMLDASSLGCKELVLPTNYRCGKRIIEWVKQHTVVTDVEAAPDAIEGVIREDMSYLDILDMLVTERQVA
jgi:hypothetical protein